MDKRKVVVYEYKRSGGASHFEKVCAGNGIFLEFGVDYEDLEHGVGNYSTGIVEMPDGSIKNVPVEMMVFNN